MPAVVLTNLIVLIQYHAWNSEVFCPLNSETTPHLREPRECKQAGTDLLNCYGRIEVGWGVGVSWREVMEIWERYAFPFL